MRRRRIMKQHRTKLLAVGGAAALAVIAAVLAFAAGGRAASGNICKTPSLGSPPSTPASCVTEVSAPHFITAAGGEAISFTKFHNESGIGGATATHVLLSVTFPGAVTIDSVRTFVAAPGSLSFTETTASCTAPNGSAGITVESCSFGNIAGDGRAKMVVAYDGASPGQLRGETQYGEGGGNPSNPPNDDQVNFDTLTLGSGSGVNGGGGCAVGGGSASGTLNGQTTQITVSGTTDTTLLCTYFDAGVRDKSQGAGGDSENSQISFTEYPTLPDGVYATVTITFPSSVKVTNKTPIFEDTNYAVPYFTTFITVTNCDNKGNIVTTSKTKTITIGTPPMGETDSSNPIVYDSCVLSRNPSTNQVVLHAIGSPADAGYRDG
jgi:hypothetical protein